MYKSAPPRASPNTNNPTTTARRRSSASRMTKYVSRLWWKISTIKDEDPEKQDWQEKDPNAKDTRPPLKYAPLPLVLPDDQNTIEKLGWAVATFPPPEDTSIAPSPIPSPGHGQSEHLPPPPPAGLHPLQSAAQDLFTASQAFFALPSPQKAAFAKAHMGSEEGWSAIPGEKEMLALRTLASTPDILKPAAQRYWALMGAYLDSVLGRLSTRLDLPDDPDHGLRRYVGACKTMPQTEEMRNSTMLRLFRYEGNEAKVVAEPHADLGLLSAVVGNAPGLEVWGGASFLPLETHFASPLSNFTLTAGRQLEALSNRRFPAGGHRVVSYGSSVPRPKGSDGYRYSIVFVLRGAQEVEVDTGLLTTGVTGPFEMEVRGIRMGEWYRRIRGAHFNINAGAEEREGQRRRILEIKGMGGGEGKEKEGLEEKGKGEAKGKGKEKKEEEMYGTPGVRKWPARKKTD